MLRQTRKDDYTMESWSRLSQATAELTLIFSLTDASRPSCFSGSVCWIPSALWKPLLPFTPTFLPTCPPSTVPTSLSISLTALSCARRKLLEAHIPCRAFETPVKTWSKNCHGVVVSPSYRSNEVTYSHGVRAFQ